MSAWTSATELLVGLACFALAVPLWQRPGVSKAVAVLFVGAGLLAVVHAAIELIG